MAKRKSYFDPEIIQHIHRLDVRARTVVEGLVSGMHQSPFHGFAVEFAQHREYVPGDEIKHIDWKVWARADRYVVKQYEEETNLVCTILLDASKSMAYAGESGISKYDYAATLAASLGFLLQRQQDAVGMVLFDETIRAALPPSAHPRQLQQMVHELEQGEPGGGTDAAAVFPRLAEQIQRRGIVVLISDLFLDAASLARLLDNLRARRHEVVLLHVLHEDELEFPFRDHTLFQGMEEAAELMAEPRALRAAYLEAMETFRREVRRLCGAAGADYVLVSTAEHLDAALTSYLVARNHTGRVLKG